MILHRPGTIHHHRQASWIQPFASVVFFACGLSIDGLYPESGKLDAATETLKAFSIGKPLVLEETFPLRCSSDELVDFLNTNRDMLNGTISFYWGQTPTELKKARGIAPAIMLEWLERFKR